MIRTLFRALLALSCALLLLSATTIAQPLIPALLAGQSNARGLALSGALPPDSYVLVARNGTAIESFVSGDMSVQLGAALDAYTFETFIWWQGEADGLAGTDPQTYYDRMISILTRVNRPTMIVELSPYPTNAPIKAVHAHLATHPYIALITTNDLPFKDTMHLSDIGYQHVSQRLQACYYAQCWFTQ